MATFPSYINLVFDLGHTSAFSKIEHLHHEFVHEIQWSEEEWESYINGSPEIEEAWLIGTSGGNPVYESRSGKHLVHLDDLAELPHSVILVYVFRGDLDPAPHKEESDD